MATWNPRASRIRTPLQDEQALRETKLAGVPHAHQPLNLETLSHATRAGSTGEHVECAGRVAPGDGHR